MSSRSRMFRPHGGCYRLRMSARRSPARWVRELDPTVSDALLAAGLTLLALPGLVVLAYETGVVRPRPG